MTSTENFQVNNTEIAGFWRRTFAFFLDGLALGLVGWIIGAFAFDYLVSLGGWGRLIGFVVALPYFGLMDSRLSHGQSLGKRAMKIKVVQRSGEPLSIVASFIRAAIVCVPFFLNGAFIDVMSLPMLVTSILGILVFGFSLTILYLLIFNRTTRQSLHDMAVGAYVVRADAEEPLVFGKLWRGHVVVAVVLIVTAGAAPVFTTSLAKTQPFADMLLLQQALIKLPGVRSASVYDAVNTNFSNSNGSNSSTSLSAKLVVDSKTIDQTALADQAVRLAFSNYPSALKRDAIVVSFIYGYDIGIASAWRTENVIHSVLDWRKRLAPAPVSAPAPMVVPVADPMVAPTSTSVSTAAPVSAS
jgi:uncharacterized RDD family membrane protein YckC